MKFTAMVFLFVFFFSNQALGQTMLPCVNDGEIDYVKCSHTKYLGPHSPIYCAGACIDVIEVGYRCEDAPDMEQRLPATPERPGPTPEGAGLETQELYASQAVQMCRRIMADESARVEDRAIAMCWVAHLVADMHQPCHAGSLYMEGVFEEADGDRGANRIPTQQRRNMHALWDQLLGKEWTLNGTRKRIVELRSDTVLVSIAEKSVTMDGGLDPQTWLSESRQEAISHVYRSEVLDPLQRVVNRLVDKPEVIDLSEVYLKDAGAVAQRRAMQAAYRLAAAWRAAGLTN